MEIAGVRFISTVELGLSSVPLYLPLNPKMSLWTSGFLKRNSRKQQPPLGFYYDIPTSGGSFLSPPVEVNKGVGGPRSVPQ